jgi:hypothetical protein
MKTTRSIPVFSTVFAVVYAVVYVVAVEHNYALITYHPVLNQFGLLAEPPKAELAMYWYGWMATAGIAALVSGLIASFVPESVTRRLWSGWSWVIPVAVMLVVGYIQRGYFVTRTNDPITPSIQQPASGVE